MKYQIVGLLSLLCAIGIAMLGEGFYFSTKKGLPAPIDILHPTKGLWANGEASLQGSPVTITKENSKFKGSITYDDRLVPHIYSEDLKATLYFQGYATARHRLFQMQFITIAAEGRLSEIFGPKTVATDKMLRKKDLSRAAAIAVKDWETFPRGITLLEAYCDGVNEYINSLKEGDLPLEFKLFGFKPEQWTPYKTALVFKYMADMLARRETDIQNTNMLTLLGSELYEMLYDEREDSGFPVIPNGTAYDFDQIIGQDWLSHPINTILKKNFYEAPPRHIGSNSWAVTGDKSTTKAPILAGDPHLSLTIPSIWYEQHLMAPDLNTYGVTVPGIPGVLIGFNENIAWTETNGGHDVTDLYMIKYADDAHKTYFFEDKILPVSYNVRAIHVKGHEPVMDTIRYTHWGPIIHQSLDGQHDIAVRWIASEVFQTMETDVFMGIMHAKNIDEFRKALQPFNAPIQNFLVASREGSIGLGLGGRLMARNYGNGRFVKDGTKEDSIWHKYVPKDQNPFTTTSNGYLSSANQRSTDATYPYYYSGSFETVRNYTINSMLNDSSSFSIEQMKAMQGNSLNSFAKKMLELLLPMMDSTSGEYTLLHDWDHQYKATSEAPVLFEIWLDKIKENTFDEIYMYKDSFDIKVPADHVLLKLIKGKCDHWIFDKQYTIAKESCQDIVLMSLEDAKVALAELEYESKGNITWKAYDPFNLLHYSRLDALSRKDILVDGCSDAINAMRGSHGPSWRMVVSLQDSVEAYGVYPGGQSGNPLSPYYLQMLDKWTQNETYKLHFGTKDQLKDMPITTKIVFK